MVIKFQVNSNTEAENTRVNCLMGMGANYSSTHSPNRGEHGETSIFEC